MFKKAVSFILALLLMLCLAACSSLTDDIANTSEDTSAPPTESGGEDQPTEPNAETTPEGFTVFPEGDYLPKEFRTSDPLPGYDNVDTFRGTWIKGGTPIACSSDTAFYYPVGSYLHYMDKASGVSGVLCGKPECPHTDSTCNGYIGFSVRGISFYDGRIWWLSDVVLYSCAPDGTDHRKGQAINRDILLAVASNEGFNAEIYFHRETMYWVVWADEVSDGVTRYHTRITAVPLDGGEPYVIYDALDEGYPNVYPYRDKLLITVNTAREDLITHDEDGNLIDYYSDVDVYLYDLNKRTAKTLCSEVWNGSLGLSRADLREDGIYQPLGYSEQDENGNFLYPLMYLPWEGGKFTQLAVTPFPAGWQDLPGRRVHFELTEDGIFSVDAATVEGEKLMDAVFTDVGVWDPFPLHVGYDEDFYYFVCDTESKGKVYIAVSADGKTLYVLE